MDGKYCLIEGALAVEKLTQELEYRNEPSTIPTEDALKPWMDAMDEEVRQAYDQVTQILKTLRGPAFIPEFPVEMAEELQELAVRFFGIPEEMAASLDLGYCFDNEFDDFWKAWDFAVEKILDWIYPQLEGK